MIAMMMMVMVMVMMVVVMVMVLALRVSLTCSCLVPVGLALNVLHVPNLFLFCVWFVCYLWFLCYSKLNPEEAMEDPIWGQEDIEDMVKCCRIESLHSEDSRMIVIAMRGLPQRKSIIAAMTQIGCAPKRGIAPPGLRQLPPIAKDILAQC